MQRNPAGDPPVEGIRGRWRGRRAAARKLDGGVQMRKALLGLLIVLSLGAVTMAGLAGPRWKRPVPIPQPVPQKPVPSVNVDFMVRTYGMEPKTVMRLSRYGLTTEELSLALYFCSVAGRPVTEDQIVFFARNKNWTTLAWYYGLPPIILEDGLFLPRRPARVRLYPPLGSVEYRYMAGGEWLVVSRGRYDYAYVDRRAGIEERVRITRDRYEYHYRDRWMEENLTVNLGTYRYDYKFKDRRTGRGFNKRGSGRPLTPYAYYEEVVRVRRVQPGFRLRISLQF